MSKRHGEILRILDGEGMVGVATLADRLGVSAETVRRDLRPLAARGVIVKVHGAVGLAGSGGEAPFERRMRENAEAKQAVARALAATVRDGDSLMIDTGTTTSFLARSLVRHEGLTVVTNSTDAARVLSSRSGNRVFLTGGEMRGDSGAMLGSEAVAFVGRFSATLAVISAGGLDCGGVSDFDPDEADFARAVLARGQRRVVVTDATKFGRRALVSVCGFDALDEIFADRAPPPDISDAASTARARFHLA